MKFKNNIKISPVNKKKQISSSNLIKKHPMKKMASSPIKKHPMKKITSSPIKKHSRKKPLSKKKKNNLYCGNNMLDIEVVNGNKVIGTRNKCLRMGFGAGYHSQINPNYRDDYEPIDRRKFYCGDKEYLPNGYDAIGNLPICLRKGYGIGVRTKYLELAR